MHNYLAQLNEAQREAVLQKEGPSLVIAGAGSGKTRVLTYRIAHLMATGVAPWNILALTFTNKAAREMTERIGLLVGSESAHSLWMGTFHSIFSRILRTESEKLGFPSSFTIYDTTDSKSLIKSIIKELKLDDAVYKPSGVLSRISNAKNNLFTAAAYKGNAAFLEEDRGTKRPELARIYEIYAARCRQSGAMDFDDLLLFTNILFRDHPTILDKYQQKFRYILVDEYQDTNFSQYLIIKKLAQQHLNICVVGDDAQSIYSFRGAKIENILNFKNDYPGHNLFKLEQNYRSTQTIVNAANSLIKKNERQIPKEVYSENSEGELIQLIDAFTDNEEGYLVVGSIFDQITRHQLRYDDFAILYRTNAQSRIFEEALRKRNIPYKIYGGLSFYQRKEIKDLIAYLRMVVNPDDSEALKRIINYPTRGIGDTTLGKLEEAASYHNLSIWQIVKTPEKFGVELNKGTLNKIQGFREFIEKFIDLKPNHDAYLLTQQVATESGLMKELHNGTTVEERSKYENVEELLNGIRDFVSSNYQEGRPVQLEFFLENVALYTDQDNEKADDRNKVTLMTIHSAKGLEFPHVYIVGMEEELFPSAMSVYSPHELEEERRLFYVALTRAEQRVTLSFAKSRYKYGSPTSTSPSRFINEIDPQFLKTKSLFSKKGMSDFVTDSSQEISFKERGSAFIKPSRPGMNLAAQRKLQQMNTNSSQSFVPDPPESIKTGMQVEHQQFGTGRVILIEGEGGDRKALIFFEKLGEKKLILKFARLRTVK
ncbi:MAG TPA: ATP-dependent DNA helicase [Marinilabiliales bacterium]|nr:MAG: ATP-dependent DNA helicase [Bacteroidetes bacterium GWD2_40_43]OFX90931.1 MAG: ATP-dependent DNA helicase [Bacteroidetes bacterium GWE2_40_63]OFY21145.1 MAG: ATP-dependent DNA helicase [Bacteroidetes bacterium GWF2_40_13]OFZ25376.1 MAG: ATP-dependent DNA helicase [Bacteroidetes bacterium RIFOXYC2_FULL_40_12]HAM98806.1 ATP-dependent DNA helicase [Marinilabiliales bacterium]